MSENMKKELTSGRLDKNLLLCLNKVFKVIIGLGIFHFVPPCFNENLVENISSILRQTGISSIVPITEPDMQRALLCSYWNGCPECRAICCLNALSVLPKGENALLNPVLCENVSRCVLDGAGIFNLSLLFALLRTSPDFGEDSLILSALKNSINKDKRSETLEIANIFFDATADFQMNFLLCEPSFSADERNTRFADLHRIELELCREKYAVEIAQIQKEIAEKEAAALEEKKSRMPKCYICDGDPIESPPVYFPITCRHKICCEKCSDLENGEKILNNKCPICQTQFTNDNIWYR